MPIFWFDVNFAFREKLVPIIRRIISSIEPAVEEIALKRGERSTENGVFWVSVLILSWFLATHGPC